MTETLSPSRMSSSAARSADTESSRTRHTPRIARAVAEIVTDLQSFTAVSPMNTRLAVSVLEKPSVTGMIYPIDSGVGIMGV